MKYVDGKFAFVEEEIPKPGKGEALIEVFYSTVNPYDRIMFNVNKDEGFVLGCDGCGVIVQVGEDVDTNLIGKKVAFLGNGYSRFTVKDASFLVFFEDTASESFDLKRAANTYVNPFTVCAMADFAKKNYNASAVISLAASSALGKQFIKLSKQ